MDEQITLARILLMAGIFRLRGRDLNSQPTD